MGDDVGREPSELVAVRCALGHQLAALRQAAELGQQQVAHKTGYSRSSVAHAEAGRQLLTRNFWKTADELVKADGALLAGYKRVQAAKQEHECQSREAELAAARARAQALHAAEYTRLIGSTPGVANDAHDEVEVINRSESADAAIIETLLRVLVDSMKRRGLFKLLGSTAAAALIHSILDNLDPDGQERVLHALAAPERVDAQVIAHIEAIVFSSLVNDSRLGPQSAIHTAWAQQEILRNMISKCPDALRPRLLSVLANSLRVCGWLAFGFDDLPKSLSFYEQARAFAHEAQDMQLAAFVLTNMSHVAIAADTPAIAVDYVVAADNWAMRAKNAPLSAFVSDMAAVSFAATGDYSAAMRRLEKTQERLPACQEQSPSPFYYYSEAMHTARHGECLLKLGQATDAIQIIDGSLKLYGARQRGFGNEGMSDVRDIAVAKLNLSSAHLVGNNIDESASVLASASGVLAENRSPRIVNRVRSIRNELRPWQGTPAVKHLDEQLRELGLLSPNCDSLGSHRDEGRSESGSV